jgi:hypothetical protein
VGKETQLSPSLHCKMCSRRWPKIPCRKVRRSRSRSSDTGSGTCHLSENLAPVANPESGHLLTLDRSPRNELLFICTPYQNGKVLHFRFETACNESVPSGVPYE